MPSKERIAKENPSQRQARLKRNREREQKRRDKIKLNTEDYEKQKEMQRQKTSKFRDKKRIETNEQLRKELLENERLSNVTVLVKNENDASDVASKIVKEDPIPIQWCEETLGPKPFSDEISMFELLSKEDIPFYVFYTKQQWNPHDRKTGQRADEFCRFLKYNKKKNNNPVLKWTEKANRNTKNITRGQLLKELKVTVVKLFQANNLRSARLVENAIQSMFQYQDLGKGRLHRRSNGGGANRDTSIDGQTHTVAVVLDLQGYIKKAIDDELIKIMPSKM